jgi:hypothetical protein
LAGNICRVRITIDFIERLFSPVHKTPIFYNLIKALVLNKFLNGVYPINSINLHTYILPPN